MRALEGSPFLPEWKKMAEPVDSKDGENAGSGVPRGAIAPVAVGAIGGPAASVGRGWPVGGVFEDAAVGPAFGNVSGNVAETAGEVLEDGLPNGSTTAGAGEGGRRCSDPESAP